MPKTKRDPDEESEEEEERPSSSKKAMTKLSHLSDHYGLVTDSKQKSKVAKTSQEEPKEVEVMENDDGNKYIELSGTRRVTVSSYRNAWFVDIREFYEDKGSGVLKPGKKGLSLTLDQWELLRNNIALVDEVIAHRTTD